MYRRTKSVYANYQYVNKINKKVIKLTFLDTFIVCAIGLGIPKLQTKIKSINITCIQNGHQHKYLMTTGMHSKT